ncbi:putative cullin repeat-like-containing domain, exocyst complex component EXOC2/Sec5 [Medicago truncatula]|uniref:Exocyst complex component SEC5 n=2 Tax=Medicago truncatula TaxID=3880 RepID=A0A072VPI1_MEDTR|nr:exocyst complex component SEC5A isoform X1 [Medicago truncatula]KEH43566.1 exocyst complex component sec5 [Medicago truncatula]RHN81572.1 putative cullin repeat-like-containing domain, exocyst complex component EXOC2/Sec5 [Medicago truncatula]
MSSDSDEDELLQMALKEQSQRDLNYGKSSSNPRKPVANYVQPPSSQPKRSAPPATAKPQSKGRVVDDDDDSEVEMLSISSGDEDNVKDQVTSSKNRGSGRTPAREEDRTWDGEEPSRWKHVDEAELARRVREMRETRTAPVAQKFIAPKFEKKSSALAKKGLTYLQSFPRGMECVDPLGLGIIDNRTLKLITESSDSSPKTDKDADSNLREKLLYFSENFDAKLFLSRIHCNTSAADLEAGALALKTDYKSRTEQRKQLVKDNFDCFVSCKTTIDDIESKLRRIEDDPEGSGTSHLFNIIQGVSSQANRALKPLFERQAQAEKIRTVQGMLQRFRTLFNLPSTIRGSISKGEYDLAVREYKKAKSIALPSHIQVGILKRVLEEVEKVMNEFKSMLFMSMEDPNIDITNLENTVRLLLDLEPESDPVWHYLNIQNQRIRGLLEQCTLDHEARMENLRNELHEKALSDARWKQIQEELSESSDINNSYPAVQSHSVDLTGEEVDGLRGRYIRRLTAVIIHHIPAFWKVALSVFSGKFAKSSQVPTDSNSNSSANKVEEKAGDVKYSSHSLDEVSAMICSTISLYGVKVTNIFHDLEESNVLRSYMSDAIEDISKACAALEMKEAAPPVAVAALRTLQPEIIRIYVLRLCSWMRASVEEVSKDVSWVIVSILERNKSPYAISYLPLTFRSAVSSAMDQINLMLRSLRSEATKSEDTFIQLQEIQESVRLAFLNCFLDFAGNLERIGIELGQHSSHREGSHFPNGYTLEVEENAPSDLGGGVTDPHQQLLIVLSNIGYCKDELSYELYDKYRHIWQHSRGKDEGNSDVQDLVICFSGLEEKVLEQYTFAKATLIRSAATSYLLNSGIQWGAAPAVKGVRDAAVELLHTLVAVHAEVFAGAKPLLDKTLGILVEGLIDTFISIFHENESTDLRSLDTNGFCQLMLELEYFETVLNPYFTSDARDSLKSLQGLLLEKATESVIEAVDNPGHNRRATRGSEDALADDKQGTTVSPDELISLAQQHSSEFLQSELERTRINTACFAESIPLDSVPEPAKSAYSPYKNSMDSPSRSSSRGTYNTGSSNFSRHRY